jgi:acyl carrier protein
MQTETAADSKGEPSAEALEAMRRQVQRLVYLAAGGKIAGAELARYDADLRQLGLDSLGYLNLLEGLERTYGVAIDLDREEDHSFLHTIDNLVRYLVARRGPP